MICNTCKTDFQVYPWAAEQSSGCASYVHFDENEIVCCYGSKHDTVIFAFIEDVPDYVETGVICDDCIDILLKNSKIHAIRTYLQ